MQEFGMTFRVDAANQNPDGRKEAATEFANFIVVKKV
jgi:hypothetical protein